MGEREREREREKERERDRESGRVKKREREKVGEREKKGRDREEVSEWVSGGSGSEREEMTGSVSERHIENIESRIEKKMQVK